MDDLIKELNQRHGLVMAKEGVPFILAVCSYLTLLQKPEIQELLLQQSGEPAGALNIWQPYQKMLADVYQPYREHPEQFEKTFANFYFVDEWLDVPFMVLLHPKSIKATIQRLQYKTRIDAIHARLPVLLKDKELLATTKPIMKRLEFSDEKSILYLNEFEIPINRKGMMTDQHRMLAYIFKHDDLGQEFFCADMAQDVFGDEYDHNPRPYFDACQEINRKVAEATKGFYPKFLLPTQGNKAFVKLNPECWAFFR